MTRHHDGSVVLVSAIAASSIPGATDSAASGGQFRYVQSGTTGTVHAFSIGSGGSLTPIQVATVPGGEPGRDRGQLASIRGGPSTRRPTRER